MLFCVPLSIISNRHQYRRWRFRRQLTCHLSPLFPGYLVCLGFIVPLENFWIIWRIQHYRWKGQNLAYAWHLQPLSNNAYLACHIYCDTGYPFIMGHLRGTVTLAPTAERLAVELSLCLSILMSKVCRGWYSNTQPSDVISDKEHWSQSVLSFLNLSQTCLQNMSAVEYICNINEKKVLPCVHMFSYLWIYGRVCFD